MIKIKQQSIFKNPDEIELLGNYDSVIVSYSTGIDSTGTLYWAIKNFPKEKIWLMYCDTGCALFLDNLRRNA